MRPIALSYTHLLFEHIRRAHTCKANEIRFHLHHMNEKKGKFPESFSGSNCQVSEIWKTLECDQPIPFPSICLGFPFAFRQGTQVLILRTVVSQVFWSPCLCMYISCGCGCDKMFTQTTKFRVQQQQSWSWAPLARNGSNPESLSDPRFYELVGTGITSFSDEMIFVEWGDVLRATCRTEMEQNDFGFSCGTNLRILNLWQNLVTRLSVLAEGCGEGWSGGRGGLWRPGSWAREEETGRQRLHSGNSKGWNQGRW